MSGATSDAPVAVPAPDAIGFRSLLSGEQGRLTLGLLFITLTVATEAMVVTAIMPAIVKDLGGVSLYGLAFSAFFLAGLAAIPVAGWAADRFGPAPPFVVLIGIFMAGSLAAALAPSMPVLVMGRVLQGYGGSALFTVSMAAVARAYQGRARVLVLSMSSTAWTLPALLGPGAGALIAATAGWRWAFGLVAAPALLALALTQAPLARLGPAGTGSARVPIRLPVQVAAGCGLLVGGLTARSWLLPVLVVAGLAIAVPALLQTLPRGSFSARPGLPALVAGGFLLNFAFYATTSFVPLMLTGLRGLTITQAGIAVTVGTVSWTGAVLLNTRLVDRVDRGRLVAAACALLAAGIGGVILVAIGAPVPLIFPSSILLGAGMGAAFNTFSLNVMALARAGAEGAAMASRNLSSSLGTAIGTGIGGALVAASLGTGGGLRPGLLAAFGLAAASALGTAALAGRSRTAVPPR